VLIEPIQPEDYFAIGEIAAQAYPVQYFEDDKSFHSKITANLGSCYAAKIDGAPVGYVISFPFTLGIMHPLNQCYTTAPPPACHYIHDLCILPAWQRHGVGTALAQSVLQIAGKPKALTSVMNTHIFWEKFGFKTAYQANYHGGPARYMVLN
jgi:GNAT superfamily N-acetyltransferase